VSEVATVVKSTNKKNSFIHIAGEGIMPVMPVHREKFKKFATY